MIIHIAGLSGSGKTTLGKRLSKNKNIKVIDTDDIDDPNAIKLLKKYKMITNKYHLELAKLNKKDLDKVLRKYRNKIIIFVGFFHGGFNSLWSKVKHGYLIKVDAQTLWTRYNLRTIKCLHDNYKNIVKLFQSKTHFSKIHKILSVQYGIRNGFDCAGVTDMERHINRFKKDKRFKKYKYLNSDDIYKSIIKLI
jgi:adenylate kinase family enzyme